MKFIKHKAYQDAKVGRYEIKTGQEILKVLIHNGDIHRSRSGALHLDIWGTKLKELRKLLEQPNVK